MDQKYEYELYSLIVYANEHINNWYNKIKQLIKNKIFFVLNDFKKT
jgi:hypothetical protein